MTLVKKILDLVKNFNEGNLTSIPSNPKIKQIISYLYDKHGKSNVDYVISNKILVCDIDDKFNTSSKKTLKDFVDTLDVKEIKFIGKNGVMLIP